MSPEDVIRTAKTTGNYTAKRLKTGFQLQFDGRPVGGYSPGSHWWILDKFASEAHEDYEAILKRFGFELRTERTRSHRWWKLNEETQAASSRLCRALAELTGEELLAMPGEERLATYAEGHVQTVYVNRYERDPRNRREAIKKHGTQCFGCRSSLRDRYGEIAEGFIHIHHTKPLAAVHGPITPDLDDLIPLCPNCHAVVHLQDPALTIDELRECIDAAARETSLDADRRSAQRGHRRP